MTNTKTVYYSKLPHSKWPLVIAATEKGFCFMGSLNKDQSELIQWLKRNRPNVELVYDEEKMNLYANQLNDYFDGNRHSLDFPLDVSSTPFQESVWEALRQIPYGQTRTYSEIAEHIGKPTAIRAAASAIGRNPAMIAIPCHRVIHKNGSITGFRGSDEMKKRLLELEQINSHLN